MIQQLKELLESAVSVTKFDMGQVEFLSDGASTSYAERPSEIIEPCDFRKTFEAKIWNDDFVSAQRAKPIVLSESYTEMKELLRNLLHEYVDSETDTVGHAFPVNGRHKRSSHSNDNSGLLRSVFVSQVGDVAYALVKGAAVLGAECVTKLMADWLEGKPLKYGSYAVIGGIFIDRHLEPLDGVCICPLPRSSTKLPGNLPRVGSLAKGDYIGRTVASLSTFVNPVFLHPDEVDGKNGIEIAAASGLGFPQLCKALSLVVDSHVESGFFWNDYLDLSAFSLSSSQSIWSYSSSGYSSSLPTLTFHRTDFETDEETVTLPEESISKIDAVELRDIIKAVAEVSSKKLNLAIERWSRSKRSAASLEDSFIDLRIALEALYLRDFTNENSQEMRFRLPLFGAWFLGTDFQERKRIRKTLRDAYDRASGVVHGGDLEFNDSNRELLSDAQDLCRRGILKQIKTGMLSSDQWGDLVLGSNLEIQ